MSRIPKVRAERGFTFVEIMTAMALLAVLVAIAWGKFSKSYEHAFKATMVSDLRNLATAEELYYRLHLKYTDDIDVLDIKPSAKSTIYITEADNRGWSAYTEMPQTPEKCELYIGSTASSPLGLAGTSEKIVCDVP